MKASCLRALTAMIHLERAPKLSAIIEATGASTYHGFLPSLVRECIASLTGVPSYCVVICFKELFLHLDTNAETYPQTFATALFSFLYHLATYEASEFNSYNHIKVDVIVSLYDTLKVGMLLCPVV